MTGVYIHIPFCARRCGYCDFFSTTALSHRAAYTEALLHEIQDRRDEINAAHTIYFGGGTPSLMPVEAIRRLLDALNAQTAEEVTLEANPGDLDEENLRALYRAGVNRLSIGIQSLNEGHLQRLGRRHTATQAIEAIQKAQHAGFDNLSVDLMYGLPMQTLIEWQNDLQRVLAMGVQHLSAYCLSYEEGTPLARKLQQGQLSPTDEEVANRMYDILCEQTEKHGLEHYEISNFALPSFRSKHNSKYWDHTPYVGIGAGAHSYDGKRTRRANLPDLEKYIAHPNGEDTYTLERLNDTEWYNETLMLALRTAEGMPVSEMQEPSRKAALPYIRQGMLVEKGNRLTATRKGIVILNRIIEDMML